MRKCSKCKADMHDAYSIEACPRCTYIADLRKPEPCPFCGKYPTMAILRWWTDEGILCESYTIECNCDAHPSICHGTEDYTIEVWNRRLKHEKEIK